MSSRRYVSCKTAIGWPVWFRMLLLSASLCSCVVENAHGTPAGGDGGVGVSRVAHEHKRKRPDAAADATAAVPEPQESLVGLTRAQVKARQGQPTEERQNEWVYTPDQPGCRDVIISEILTFRKGVVASVRLQRSQTNKVCGGAERRAE